MLGQPEMRKTRRKRPVGLFVELVDRAQCAVHVLLIIHETRREPSVRNLDVRRQSNRDQEARFVRDTFQPVDSPMRLVDSSVCVV
jgi:hypothetical protein